jgi:hypothetical protein
VPPLLDGYTPQAWEDAAQAHKATPSAPPPTSGSGSGKTESGGGTGGRGGKGNGNNDRRSGGTAKKHSTQPRGASNLKLDGYTEKAWAAQAAPHPSPPLSRQAVAPASDRLQPDAGRALQRHQPGSTHYKDIYFTIVKRLGHLYDVKVQIRAPKFGQLKGLNLGGDVVIRAAGHSTRSSYFPAPILGSETLGTIRVKAGQRISVTIRGVSQSTSPDTPQSKQVDWDIVPSPLFGVILVPKVKETGDLPLPSVSQQPERGHAHATVVVRGGVPTLVVGP